MALRLVVQPPGHRMYRSKDKLVLAVGGPVVSAEVLAHGPRAALAEGLAESRLYDICTRLKIIHILISFMFLDVRLQRFIGATTTSHGGSHSRFVC
jgi:hypothetical protein